MSAVTTTTHSHEIGARERSLAGNWQHVLVALLVVATAIVAFIALSAGPAVETVPANQSNDTGATTLVPADAPAEIIDAVTVVRSGDN